MDSTEILGYVAMTTIMIAFLPQAYQVWKTKSVDDVSLSTYTLLILGAVLWGIYGFLKADNPIIYTNVTLVIVQSSILVCKFKYGKK